MIVPDPRPFPEHKFWEKSDHPGRAPGITAKQQITHDAIIDFVLANPRATLKQIAEAFGYRAAQSISIIINSDAFQARLQARRGEVVDPVVLEKIENQLKGQISASMEIIARKLETSDDANFALQVFEKSTKAAGYGAPKNAPVVQQNFVMHLPGPARSSAEWLQSVQAPEVEVLKAPLENLPSE